VTVTRTSVVTVRCKAFSTEDAQPYRCMVDVNGAVRVYDSVAGYFTTCHSLSPAAVARIRRLIRQTQGEHNV
jgi:hypothetical protein